MMVGPPVADLAVGDRDPQARLRLFLDPFCFLLAAAAGRGPGALRGAQVRGLATVSTPSLAAMVANQTRPRSIPAVRGTGGAG